MNENKKEPVNDVELDLLKTTASELIPELAGNLQVRQIAQMAYTYYDQNAKQEFQVQVVVTRHEPDFLCPFYIEQTI